MADNRWIREMFEGQSMHRELRLAQQRAQFARLAEEDARRAEQARQQVQWFDQPRNETQPWGLNALVDDYPRAYWGIDRTPWLNSRVTSSGGALTYEMLAKAAGLVDPKWDPDLQMDIDL